MSGMHSSVRATLALIALASLAGIASIEAQAREVREPHEQRAPERERQPARHEAVPRQSHHTSPSHAAPARATAHREALRTREQPVAERQREMLTRPLQEQRAVEGAAVRDTHRAPVDRLGAVPRSPVWSPPRVVRFGNNLNGTVERTIRPGFTSRTFVSGGRVLYTRVYQNHVWHQYGQAFGYETFVPAVRFPAVYYGWALSPWPRPVAYSWGWRVQPWYPMYGVLFVPYPVYESPDQWMTDYVIAQSMQSAYAAQNAAPMPQPPPQQQPPATLAPDPGVAPPAAQPGDPSLAPQSGDTPPVSAAPPPAITPQIKAELNTQIKVQLQEQQAVAMPATLRSQDTPPALRPGHVFFEVVQPIEVPTAHGHCSLSANDYIRRTGGMSNDDWMIPVVVELSRPSDCPEGLSTRLGLNDLNAMENEQEAQVLEAMQAASKGMGPNGPPSDIHPTLVADGTAPDAGALDALRQAR